MKHSNYVSTYSFEIPKKLSQVVHERSEKTHLPNKHERTKGTTLDLIDPPIKRTCNNNSFLSADENNSSCINTSPETEKIESVYQWCYRAPLIDLEYLRSIRSRAFHPVDRLTWWYGSGNNGVTFPNAGRLANSQDQRATYKRHFFTNGEILSSKRDTPYHYSKPLSVLDKGTIQDTAQNKKFNNNLGEDIPKNYMSQYQNTLQRSRSFSDSCSTIRPCGTTRADRRHARENSLHKRNRSIISGSKNSAYRKDRKSVV